eukprot:15449522-Alexandrium_andersonii.AAC.1
MLHAHYRLVSRSWAVHRAPVRARVLVSQLSRAHAVQTCAYAHTNETRYFGTIRSCMRSSHIRPGQL